IGFQYGKMGRMLCNVFVIIRYRCGLEGVSYDRLPEKFLKPRTRYRIAPVALLEVRPIAIKIISDEARSTILNGCSRRNDDVNIRKLLRLIVGIYDRLIHGLLVIPVVGKAGMGGVLRIGPRLM